MLSKQTRSLLAYALASCERLPQSVCDKTRRSVQSLGTVERKIRAVHALANHVERKDLATSDNSTRMSQSGDCYRWRSRPVFIACEKSFGSSSASQLISQTV